MVPLIAISLQALVFFFTTLLIDRERPDVEQLDDSPPTSSFPSGHTGAATGLYFTLGLMALRITNPVLRSVVVSVCLAIPFLVAAAGLLVDKDPGAADAVPEPVSGRARLSHPSHPR